MKAVFFFNLLKAPCLPALCLPPPLSLHGPPALSGSERCLLDPRALLSLLLSVNFAVKGLFLLGNRHNGYQKKKRKSFCSPVNYCTLMPSFPPSPFYRVHPILVIGPTIPAARSVFFLSAISMLSSVRNEKCCLFIFYILMMRLHAAARFDDHLCLINLFLPSGHCLVFFLIKKCKQHTHTHQS